MRRAIRLLGTLLIVGGVLTIAWAVLVWQWEDPFTAIYTRVEQRHLSAQLDRRLATYHPPPATTGTAASGGVEADSTAAARRAVAKAAAAYRSSLHRGDPVGRLSVGAIGLEIVLVQGTDDDSLKKGPGHYVPSRLPGQGQLIYVAGHRTTYLAPFSHIDRLKPGDWITIELPYGTFKYVVTGHRIVPATDLAVLRSHDREVLVLQACHPRFFATHRYLVYARPATMQLPGGKTYTLGATRRAAAS
jgi:sortase A